MNYWYGFDEFIKSGSNSGTSGGTTGDSTDGPAINPTEEHKCENCVSVSKFGYIPASVSVNVRYGPSTEYNRKFYWSNGIMISISLECNSWYYGTSSDGKSGWVSGKYVEITNNSSGKFEDNGSIVNFDINKNGTINIEDGMILAGIILDADANIGDLNNDGKINLIDLKRLLEFVVAY